MMETSSQLSTYDLESIVELLPLDAEFITDGFLPDGTHISPGTEEFKSWIVKNNGSQSWPCDTSLHYIGGDHICIKDSIPIKPINSGEQTELTVTLKSPTTAGSYSCVFRLKSGNQSFGHRLWANIVVDPNLPSKSINELP